MVGRAVPSPNRRYRRVWPPRTKGQHLSNPYAQHQLKLIRHTGALILWQQRTYVVSGTREQCEAAYKSAQTYNLLVGWWSLVSLLAMNWIALISKLQCDSAGASRRRRGVRSPRPARHRPSSRSPGTHTGGLVSRPVRGGTALLGRCDVDPLDPSATSPLTSTGAPDPQARRRPAPPGTTPCFAR